MSLLNFSDVLRKTGIDPAKTKLIRHALSDGKCRAYYEAGMIDTYTALQKRGFSKGYAYWAVFLNDKGSYARFYALYKVNGVLSNTAELMPKGCPTSDDFQGEGSFFLLQRMDCLKEYEQRLLIDWGKSTRMWHQKGTTEKPIIAIQTVNKQPFPGYEKIVLSFDQLETVVENTIDYELWQTALSSVKGVYLIADRETGKQYVGSAYGSDGLLGRWRCYVDSYHGNNKQMIELIDAKPEQYKHFQFSILQLIEKTATADEVISIENLWKKKLLSIEYGLNEN